MAFTGKVVLVTGAASGMGRVAARNMGSAGASVAALDVNEDGLRETAAGHDTIHTWPLDVTNAEQVHSRVREVEAALGPIDRVYNAAGIMPTAHIMEQDTDTIHRVMAVNYGGTVNVTKCVMPGMLERRRGDLINFASIAGWIPFLHFGAYNASKFAVVAFTEVLYHENRGKGVRIVCLCPPPVNTPLFDQAASRPRTPDVLAKLTPEAVVDAIEAGIEKERLFIFPGPLTAMMWRLRRWTPRLGWWRVHQIEGY